MRNAHCNGIHVSDTESSKYFQVNYIPLFGECQQFPKFLKPIRIFLLQCTQTQPDFCTFCPPLIFSFPQLYFFFVNRFYVLLLHSKIHSLYNYFSQNTHSIGLTFIGISTICGLLLFLSLYPLLIFY